MNQSQSASQDVVLKFAQLQLSETDDDISRQCSPILDKHWCNFLTSLPSQIKQKCENILPDENYLLLKQNDDSMYYGMLQGSLKHGKGIQIWGKLGNVLEGTWWNDLLEGCCKMSYANGDIFQCQFSGGKTYGFGIFQTEKKIVKGIWIDNMIQGEGQELKFDGSKYYGQFCNGKKEGRGIQILNDGCKYEGMFHNNKFDGEGIFQWSDQSYYQGHFIKGIIMGIGCYVSDNGLQLIGQFAEIHKSQEDEIMGQPLQRILFVNQYNQSLVIEKLRVLTAHL